MANQNYPLKLGDREILFELTTLPEQANGSVLVRAGDTMVLVTCVMSSTPGPNQSFFPLTVEYEERFYAAGKILGSRFIRREGRPSDEAIITARLIDRSIRPLFPDSLSREVQVIATCLSWDGSNDPDVIGLLGASCALLISDIPWSGPIGAVRVGRVQEKFVINPTYEERAQSDMDIVFSGVKEGDDILLNMIEAEGEEIPEQILQEALQFATPFLEKAIEFQKELARTHQKEKIPIEESKGEKEVEQKFEGFLRERLEKALFQGDKKARLHAVGDLKKEFLQFIENEIGAEYGSYGSTYFEKNVSELVHSAALEKKMRVDGRALTEIREMRAEVGVLPRTHGSGLFERGQTKTLSILTLGAPGDQRLLEGMEFIGKKRFMHHYNFPPYAPGEVRPLRGPGRREIGHGILVEKALLPVIPNFDEFPYTIRIVTEVLSSNGSTSMASTCSASLALMDAGVPIVKPVAGISIGLMSSPDGNYTLLTDIQGPEDHHGDMDFKVAGTKEGVTAIQLDVKIKGITKEIFKEALERAKEARNFILDEVIGKTLSKPRPQLSPFAPRIYVITINPEKIGLLIGPGGKTINKIIEEYGVEIDIEESGEVFITGEKEEQVQKAVAVVRNLTKDIQVGEIFEGKVRRITDFGAFVELAPGQEGLVHISQLADHRVKKVEDVVKVGDIIPVKVIGIDEQGRINLSFKEAKEEYNRKNRR